MLFRILRCTASGQGLIYPANPRDIGPDLAHFKVANRFPIDVEYGINSTGRGTPEYWAEEYNKFPKFQYDEYHRPYQLFLSYWEQQNKQGKLFKTFWDLRNELGCYCSVTYRLVHTIGVCALITHRHALATATSISVFLEQHDSGRGSWPTFGEGLLTVTYDRMHYGNSTLRAEVIRIHNHPRYSRDQNFTHPLLSYDLAVLTLQHPVRTFVGDFRSQTFLCNRVHTPVIDMDKILHLWIVGFDFIKYYNRQPNPNYKYALRTRDYIPCPKVGWGWYYCVADRTNWAPAGLDTGAVMHVHYKAHHTEESNGLMALGAFSTDLRANSLVHYFTAVNNHETIEFMYDAYMGLMNYTWLEMRFYDAAMRAPIPDPSALVPWLGVHAHCAFYHVDQNQKQKKYCVGGRKHRSVEPTSQTGGREN